MAYSRTIRGAIDQLPWPVAQPRGVKGDRRLTTFVWSKVAAALALSSQSLSTRALSTMSVI